MVCPKKENFVKGIVDVYENIKHDSFYKKGNFYNSEDRKLSSNVIKYVSENNYEIIEKSNEYVDVVIPDEFGTVITLKVVDGNLKISLNAGQLECSKINKQAMTLLVTSLYERLSTKEWTIWMN